MTAPSIDLSFEVFPAASEVAQAGLAKTVSTLAALSPRFVSITHGADGSDQNRTLTTIDSLRIANPELGLAGHLTSRAGSKGETLANAEDYERLVHGGLWPFAETQHRAQAMSLSPIPRVPVYSGDDCRSA